MSQTVLNKIIEGKIVAIVRGIPSTKILGLAAALEKGGVNCIEVTFDQSSEEKARDTLAAIRTIKEGLGDKVCVGAGTVMSVEQVRQAAEAGAEYMISPNVDEEVIRETKRLDKVQGVHPRGHDPHRGGLRLQVRRGYRQAVPRRPAGRGLHQGG